MLRSYKLNCYNSVTCGGTTNGTTVGATDGGVTGCTGRALFYVWYKFTATSPNHIITVTGASGFDAVVDLRSGACNGSNIACADATFSGGTEVINYSSLIIGSVYYVRVFDYYGVQSPLPSVSQLQQVTLLGTELVRCQ